jgi:hypothetical protein
MNISMGGFRKIMKKKKMIMPFILLLVFIIPIFSGCVYPKGFPIWTRPTDVNYDFKFVNFKGQVGIPFCMAKNHRFVYDNVSHENWTDYPFIVYDTAFPNDIFFQEQIGFYDIKHGITYHVRAVAYCYDFKKPFQNYAEGYYQGDEQTFFVE